MKDKHVYIFGKSPLKKQDDYVTLEDKKSQKVHYLEHTRAYVLGHSCPQLYLFIHGYFYLLQK